MPLPIPFYLRNNQNTPLTHTQLDGNLSILSTKIDNTTCSNLGSGIGIFRDKEVGANEGTMNLYSLSGTNGITIGVSGNSLVIGSTGLAQDYYTTGLTFNQGTYDLTVSVNDGNDYTVGLGILATDMTITGGTYDPSTGIGTFTNNSGGTFQVTGFLTGYTDTNTFVTGGTFSSSPDILTFTNNAGVSFDVPMTGTSSTTPNYWISGSSGNHSIKTINSSSVDATGDFAVAQGENTLASGQASHAEGNDAIASGNNSHAEGNSTISSGDDSHAEGDSSVSSGNVSHAEGLQATASGNNSHAEGDTTVASGLTSHAEGRGAVAGGYASHAEGRDTYAFGDFSHSEGTGTYALGSTSHAQNVGNKATGNNSHAGGFGVVASGMTSFAHFHSTNPLYGANSDFSAILGGEENNMDSNSEGSVLLGGASNIIYNTKNSAIIGGRDNNFIHTGITSIKNSVIIGGDSLTGKNENTVYVPYLNVNNVPGGTPVANLAITSDGLVITGGTSGGGAGFNWCDANVMSGNTSGCCLDQLWVTTLSGCSPIHVGGSNRIQGTNGNVNVDGILNIKNQSNFNTQPNNNDKTAHLLVWNSNSTLGDLTVGDVEYVHKKQLFKRVIKPFTPWEPAGPIEVGNDPTGPGIDIVIGPNNGIKFMASSAETIINLGETATTVTGNFEITPVSGKIIKVDTSTSTELTTSMDTVDGFVVKSEVGGVTKRTAMSADEIETTGTIKASVISATTVMIGGVSLSGCCEIDSYYSGGTPAGAWTWDLSGQSTNFEITLVAGTSQLDLDNVRNGEYGTLIVHQDSVGGRALTFGDVNGSASTHYVVNGGGGVPKLTTTALATDILSFTYNGNSTFWTVGNDYT